MPLAFSGYWLFAILLGLTGHVADCIFTEYAVLRRPMLARKEINKVVRFAWAKFGIGSWKAFAISSLFTFSLSASLLVLETSATSWLGLPFYFALPLPLLFWTPLPLNALVLWKHRNDSTDVRLHIA